jgi:hypothetical protein
MQRLRRNDRTGVAVGAAQRAAEIGYDLGRRIEHGKLRPVEAAPGA